MSWKAFYSKLIKLFSKTHQFVSNFSNVISPWINLWTFFGIVAVIITFVFLNQNPSPQLDENKLAEKLVNKLDQREDEKKREIAALKQTIQDLQAAQREASAEQQDQFKAAYAALEQGQTEKAEDLFAAIAKQKETSGKTANKEAARAHRNIGNLAYLHDTQKALKAYTRAVVLDPDDAAGWNRLGHIQTRLGELEKAKKSYEKVLALGNRVEDKTIIAAALGNLGVIYRRKGNLPRAEDQHRRALVLNEELGRKEGMASQLGNLGLIYQTQGNLSRAEDHHLRALALNKELGRKKGIAIQLGNLGLIYQTQGNFPRAEDHHRRALALYEELGRKEGMASQLGNLGMLYEEKSDIVNACKHWQKAQKLFKEIGMLLEIEQVQRLRDKADCTE